MVHELLELADELNHKGLTVIMSTHDVESRLLLGGRGEGAGEGEDDLFRLDAEGFFSDAGRVHRVGLTEPLLFEMNRSLSAVQVSRRPPIPETSSSWSRSSVETGIDVWKAVRHASGRIEPRAADHFAKGDARRSGSVCLGRRPGRSDARTGWTSKYRFDALEKGLAEVSSGRDFVLIADDAWHEMVERRLEADREWYGTKLRLLPLSLIRD